MPTCWQRGAQPIATRERRRQRIRRTTQRYDIHATLSPGGGAPAHTALPSSRRQSIRQPAARSQPLREVFAGWTHSRHIVSRRQARRRNIGITYGSLAADEHAMNPCVLQSSAVSFERVVAPPDELARNFAERLVVCARNVQAEGRRLSLVLPGGSVAEMFFPMLAGSELEWNAVELFWGDERAVPPNDPESNYWLAETLLLSRVQIRSSACTPDAGRRRRPRARRAELRSRDRARARSGRRVSTSCFLASGPTATCARSSPDTLRSMSRRGESCP